MTYICIALNANLTTVGTKRSIFRGKNLGSSLTDAQHAEIQAGTFNDLFLGDYWEIDGRVWRIVDFDYWLNTGDVWCTDHHLVIMPDRALYDYVMNDANTTVGGYIETKLRKQGFSQAATIINNSFGINNILYYRAVFVDAVLNGKPSHSDWYDAAIELPTEVMMYGHFCFSPMSDGTTIPSIGSADKMQLALMQVEPTAIDPSGENLWLRDVTSNAAFSFVGSSSTAGNLNASQSAGIRPVFGIK